MTEPSAWAMRLSADLEETCMTKHLTTYEQEGVCRSCRRNALDAAWRAGAEAMHQLLIDVVDEEPTKSLVRQLPRPAPGEER